MQRPFLGVEQSMQGRPWRSRLDPGAEVQADAIRQQHEVPDLLARIMAGRGQTAATALAYLEPSVRAAMPDPSVLNDMEPAVVRLCAAVARRERVAIFGDYDVDGACAAALLAEYLQQAGLDPVVHIPDRIVEGYGPNIPAIRTLARGGATLLVTVDCGTTSLEPLAEARALGLDCLVIDHHAAAVELPPAVAIVNPNRLDDLSGLGHLCAAGVVFMVLVGLHRALRAQGFWTGRAMPDLLSALDLVALATVADVVPLEGLNRAFVTKGLAVMRLRERPGLAALFDVAGTNGPPAAFHLGFLVGPRINAGGRIGDAALGARLLLTQDAAEARAIAETLDGLNRERRAIEAAAVEEAEALALAALGLVEAEATSALVMSGPGWHPGVVGLVASRLRERHERPAFAIAFDGPVGTGSGRSIPGVDLGRAVRAAVAEGILLKGGGHAMAAGVTLEHGRLDAFRTFLEAQVGDSVARAREVASFGIDGVLSAEALAPDLAATIERAGPFGSRNAEPVFALPRHIVRRVLPVGADHLRVTATSGSGATVTAMAFRAAAGPFGAGLRAAEGHAVHLAGSVSLSRFGGTERTELRLLDAALPAEG